MSLLKEISITELSNLRIGHTSDHDAKTGVTVLYFPNGAKAGCDISGGGPASRETPLTSPVTAGHGYPVGGGGPTQSRGARLLLEHHHLPSSDPKGGSERPLHQLAWSQALLAGELEAENLSFPVQLSDAGSLHCSCGVWSVKETPTVSCEVEARVLLGARFYR